MTSAEAPGGGREPRQRLFTAVEVPAAVRDELAAATAPLRASHPMLRWTDPSTWHVTVVFAGSVDGEGAAAVDAAAAEVAAGSAPMELALSGTAGTFGGGVLYAALAISPPLEALAAGTAAALGARGLEVEERPYVPHITLARVPRGTRLPLGVESAFSGPAAAWTADRLLVVRSRLSVGGAVHEVRGEHPLG